MCSTSGVPTLAAGMPRVTMSNEVAQTRQPQGCSSTARHRGKARRKDEGANL
jgi:hypothetical protein